MKTFRDGLTAELEAARETAAKLSSEAAEAKREADRLARDAETATTRFQTMQQATAQLLSVTPEEKPGPPPAPRERKPQPVGK